MRARGDDDAPLARGATELANATCADERRSPSLDGDGHDRGASCACAEHAPSRAHEVVSSWRDDVPCDDDLTFSSCGPCSSSFSLNASTSPHECSLSVAKRVSCASSSAWCSCHCVACPFFASCDEVRRASIRGSRPEAPSATTCSGAFSPCVRRANSASAPSWLRGFASCAAVLPRARCDDASFLADDDVLPHRRDRQCVCRASRTCRSSRDGRRPRRRACGASPLELS